MFPCLGCGDTGREETALTLAAVAAGTVYSNDSSYCAGLTLQSAPVRLARPATTLALPLGDSRDDNLALSTTPFRNIIMGQQDPF